VNQFSQDEKRVIKPAESAGIQINYKRVIFRILRYWYVVVTSLTIALVAAFLYNRYATRIYPVSASVMFKEKEDVGTAEILYSNPLVNPYRNYYNEIYIIKSLPLIKSVLDDLNFSTTFSREGNILTSEIYDYPVTAVVLNGDQIKSARFNFTPISITQFQLKSYGEEIVSEPRIFTLNDTIEYQGLQVVFSVRNMQGLKNEIQNTVIFQYTATEHLAAGYSGKLIAEWAGQGSGVLNLGINGVNPHKERDFLTGFIKKYQQYDLQNKNEIASRTIDFITSQLREISDSMKIVEGNIIRFKGKNVITDLAGESARLYNQVEKVEDERVELLARTNYYDYLLDYIENDSTLDPVVLPSALGITDRVLSDFVSQMMQLQLDLKLIEKTEKLGNPLIDQKRARLQEIKKNIREAIRTQRSGDKIREDFLLSRINEREQRLSGLPILELEYLSIKRNFTLLENLYIYMLQKRAEASISKASNVSDIVVVNPPASGAAISPRPTFNYVVASAAGLAFPILIFVVLELLNTRIQSKEDIDNICAMPFIGGVGHKTIPDNKAVITSPKSAVAESFRALRSNLNYFLLDKRPAIILVTSSISGEGKTFTCINLATVVALSGKKTLILGADLRKPKLFNDFNLNNSVGLSSYLAGLSTFEETIQFTGQPNLYLASGGPVPPNPSELMMSARMDEFLSEAKKQFEYIIIDSPPLAIVADAYLLNEKCDHMIFVTRQDYTPKPLLRTVSDYYQSGRLKNVSILLNDIFNSGPGYGYGYTYGYGYGYGYGYIYGRKKNGQGYYSEE
jgi:capsular exopolysaccharide synthesis family protein